MNSNDRRTLSWLGWMLYIIVGGLYINLSTTNHNIILLYFISATALGAFLHYLSIKPFGVPV